MAADHRRLLAGLALAWLVPGCHQILGPSPVDSNWRVIDTPHFVFNVRPGSFAEQNTARLSEVLEDQYAYTQRALAIQYAGRIRLFLYESAADADFESERSGTAYPDTEAVRAVMSPPLETTFALLAHESNHVIQQNTLGKPGTYFLGEGLPSVTVSERYHQGGITFRHTWSARNLAQIPALLVLIDDDKWNDYNSQMTYNASASFLAFLLDQSGPEQLKQLQSVNSSAFAGRFRQIYGRSLDDAEREWRTFLSTYRPPVGQAQRHHALH